MSAPKRSRVREEIKGAGLGDETRDSETREDSTDLGLFEIVNYSNAMVKAGFRYVVSVERMNCAY